MRGRVLQVTLRISYPLVLSLSLFLYATLPPLHNIRNQFYRGVGGDEISCHNIDYNAAKRYSAISLTPKHEHFHNIMTLKDNTDGL